MNRLDELRLLKTIYPEQMTAELMAELEELKADYFLRIKTGRDVYQTVPFSATVARD